MMPVQPSRPNGVIGPTGKPLTVDNLPPAGTKRRVISRKAEVVAAVQTVHRSKQRHKAKRIFERLRDEHGFAGGQTIVKDYVRERCRRLRGVFVPLAYPPGDAQADFGEADAIIAGVAHGRSTPALLGGQDNAPFRMVAKTLSRLPSCKT